MTMRDPNAPEPTAGLGPGRGKRAFIKAYGCQMNVYDAERMGDLLAREGYAAADDAAGADLVILNTCHIRERASQKMYSELGRLRGLKGERAAAGIETRIVVAGCIAQAEGAEVLRRAPGVDLVIGPGSLHRLPALLAGADSRAGGHVETDFPVEDKFTALPAPTPEATRRRGVSAFVTVQEGCDKFCAFCVVPYTRGAEYSRPVAAILAEVIRLTEAGVREVTLIGQNVNAYHGEGPGGGPWSLPRLIAHLAELPNLARIRYTTSHPRDMDEALIKAHGGVPKLMPFLHLPVQSGSDRVLRAMNRGHGADDYRRIVDQVRAARPDIALSSDFIVGFPGESDTDFEDTMRLARDVAFASNFAFKYSPRPGTPAAGREGQVDEAVKSERLGALQTLLEETRQAFNQATLGRDIDVLFEKSARYPGQLSGKSPYLQQVQAQAPLGFIGEVRAVTVMGQERNSLNGRLAGATMTGGAQAA